MPRTTFLAIGAAIVALVLSACGGSSSSSTSASPAASSTPATSSAPPSQIAGALTIAADPSGQLKFTKSSLTAKAGKVTIRFTNNAPLAHNLTIASRSGTVFGATPTFQGGTKTLTLNLKPGTYTFYCSVPGHRDGGMQGTLMVR
jgi:uncharacterized cupredoxin-like copper-binding protein